MLTYIFGWISNTITFLYKIPQMYKLYTVKKVDGLSLYSLLLQALGYILYTAHGYYNNDPTILWGMILPFVENCIIISMYLYYNAVHTRSVGG